MIYTISTNFFEELKEGESSYLASILFPFVNEHVDCKIAIDSHSVILEKYLNVAKGSLYADIVKIWIELLANIPCSKEQIKVDLSNMVDGVEMCEKLCSSVNGARNLIIHSVSTYPKELDMNNSLIYEGKVINVIDKDKAHIMINMSAVTINNISNSMLANGNISDSTNSTKL